ncbi:MAG TPA: ADP-ribosylglycohydrolase family protein [Steroidobacteraceae bacterium]|jgi:ADP-ribosylglycohydrolase|nr:ADP-ribosylglycohydrolase family protein [Steroidobacteraceae bacterium]
MAIVPTSISKPLAESYWVIPGRLLAGKYPGGKTPKEAERRVAALLEAGFDAFIDLTEADELPPYDIYLPASAQYVRKSIPDHGVPRYPEHMAEIQAEIDAALKRGRRVYVHCRAGIGRTGVTVACHLIEQGMSADAALIRLNELWQGNERSRTWPDVPETDEQRDYILTWVARADPMQAPDVMDAARTLRERFQGAFMGLAVGDALAAHTQFRKPGTFAAVGDLLGGGPFDQPRGAWTDDTAMALLLAESLLEREGFDAHDQVQRYVRWQREGYGSATGQCVGISANVARALATAQYKRQPFSGSHDPEQLDKDPLSRVAPVVMYFFADVSTAVAKAAEAARLTAQAPTVLDCVRLLAAMVHLALSGRDKAAVLRPPRELWLTASTRPEVQAVYEGSYARRQPPEITGSGGILQALEAALWAFHNGETFRAGALLAANLGGDSDVVAAAYGQLAGSYHGVSAIPGIWRNSMIKQEVVIDSADRLLTHALVTLGT